MGCLQFNVGDNVKFHSTPFFWRAIGFLASVRLAIENNVIFKVVATSTFLGEQFILVKDPSGRHPFEPLNAHLFEKA
ncbi:MAG: hypothetical protein UT43_C0015G0004 [Parcubacteria group bacterium GW2011_GWC1_39_29]|uniref:Uncharacterized protein n=1 Tax=Candidatus Yanofskybacteria bacterium GW2011_GWD1_39_16 TaxID=1619030 RepID=A0A837HZL7_9BACT|nr:MAG: hypothetical protein UT35_C0022G0004 [Candidatus Yanofskybacteria bacterium GW2011_GWD1_39_16]KKR14823.1 MAG: hypothetical protein UT43_C0015G0004 [Parcubacteria group bacterium GW2011_GWC1_39_29]